MFNYNGQNSPTGLDGPLNAAVPVAIEAALCNALSKDCWFQIPTQYDTISAAAKATAVASALNLQNKAYFEFGNEIFLSFTTGALYATQMGIAYGFPTSGFGNRNQYDWYGMQVKQLFDAMKAVWPAGDNRFNGTETSQIGSYAFFKTYKLDGSDLTFDSSGNYCSGSGCTIVTNYTSAPNRPVDDLTTISIGMYFGPSNMLGSSAISSSPPAALPCSTSIPKLLPVYDLGDGWKRRDDLGYFIGNACGHFSEWRFYSPLE